MGRIWPIARFSPILARRVQRLRKTPVRQRKTAMGSDPVKVTGSDPEYRTGGRCPPVRSDIDRRVLVAARPGEIAVVAPAERVERVTEEAVPRRRVCLRVAPDLLDGLSDGQARAGPGDASVALAERDGAGHVR